MKAYHGILHQGIFLFVILNFLFAPVSSLELSGISVSEESFAPARGQTVQIFYTLDSPAIVNIKIYDPDLELVREVIHGESRVAGSHKESWDGKDTDGTIVPDEAYFFIILAKDKAGNEAVYDPTTVSGGDEFDITSAKIDQVANTITYRLEKPSRVLIRIGISGGPLLQSLANWQPRVSGEITEYWNGRDKDGLIDLINHSRFKMVITGFGLVEHSIIAYGNTKDDYYSYKSRQKNSPPRKPARTATPRPGIKISPHYLRPRVLDRPIDLIVTFPDKRATDDKSILVASAKEIVRIELGPGDKALLIDEPFEVSFFLDGDYYSEEEVGYVPYNWVWNVGNLEAGEHILTVNLSSFKDIIGIQSHKIKIEE